ncbi:MAG TPA: hypothetical protein VIG51_01915 [Candidatus Baltobacteraceae bacterium]|jgi:hypothetical protein
MIWAKEAIVLAHYVVAGIARTSDPAQLEKLLMGCAELDAQRLTIITKASATAAHEDSPLRFAHATGSTFGGRGGTDGTGVPGIGGRSPTLSSLVAGGHVPHYLQGVAIPRDAAENYDIAVDEGRSVVTFKATPEEAANAESALRGCGLVNVRTFKPPPVTAKS